MSNDTTPFWGLYKFNTKNKIIHQIHNDIDKT